METRFVIAVSSFRPLKDCSAEILRNQLRARESWECAFTRIIYFGFPSAALAGKNVTFVPCETFPRIAELVRICSEQVGWSAIINGDIVVSNIMPKIERELLRKGALAAMSRRFEFENENFNAAKIVDLGLDFFGANQIVWKHIASAIPAQYRIGHCMFDTWMLGFLASHYFKWLWDITPCRAVFHPRHGDRRTIFAIDKETGREHCALVQWPINKLRLA